MAIEISVMIEGQDGLSWPRWQRLVRATEDLGFDGLYRSDHFSNPEGPFKDAIETWISLGWVAANTSRIAFGTMVSPLSFRNPSILAWQASSIDALAGGRLRLGVGAGWQDREHNAFGFDLLDTHERFVRFEEGIQVLKALTRSPEPSTVEGKYFQIRDARLQPRSPRADGPAIVIGGNGPKRTLPLVAKYADEWNAVYPRLDAYGELTARLNELLALEGRQPSDVKRTVMSRLLVGRDDADLAKRIDAKGLQGLRERDAPVGTPAEIVEKLAAYQEAGVQGIMLQCIDMDDISSLEQFAADVLPQLRG